jgi:hypothetical protein
LKHHSNRKEAKKLPKFEGILDKRILERKPNLKLCSNHYKCGPRIYRVWNHGTAISDGRGWYMAKATTKKVKANG